MAINSDSRDINLAWRILCSSNRPAYCASPAAGMGGSLAVEGAAALTDALEKHYGNFDLAFQDYNNNLRPFIEEVQAEAAYNVKEKFVLATEEAIRKRNMEGF